MNRSLLREFIEFLIYTKKWWLAPIFIVLFILGFLIVFSTASPLSPFIYGAV